MDEQFSDSCVNISVAGDERDSHFLRKKIEKRLQICAKRIQNYKISIDLKEKKQIGAYTSSNIVKEQKTLYAEVTILDSRTSKTVGSTCIDSVVNYEVNDTAPLQSIFSEKAISSAMIEELAGSISAFILSKIQ
jgi:hypothetical protein